MLDIFTDRQLDSGKQIRPRNGSNPIRDWKEFMEPSLFTRIFSTIFRTWKIFIAYIYHAAFSVLESIKNMYVFPSSP